MSPVIHGENIVAGYGDTPVLHDITYGVAKGSFTGIIGPNGSGKTTLLRVFSGVMKPDKGVVAINGEAMHALTQRKIASEVAVVSQYVDPVPISVYEYVSLGRIPYYKSLQFFSSREDALQIEKYMRLSDVWHLKDKKLTSISGGERQLVQIARALVQQPQIILLDEPISNLDISHRIQILDSIKTLCTRLGFTVLVVLHDLNLAAEYCERIVLMQQGRIYKTGTPDEVLTYSCIEEVYHTQVLVEVNKLSGRPLVVPVTEAMRRGAHT